SRTSGRSAPGCRPRGRTAVWSGSSDSPATSRRRRSSEFRVAGCRSVRPEASGRADRAGKIAGRQRGFRLAGGQEFLERGLLGRVDREVVDRLHPDPLTAVDAPGVLVLRKPLGGIVVALAAVAAAGDGDELGVGQVVGELLPTTRRSEE